MKKKITFIDILIVLAVVLVAAFLLFKVSGTSGSHKKTVTYTVMVTNILPEVADGMVPDDRVLLDSKDNAYGRVTNVSVMPSEDSHINLQTEKYVTNKIEDRKDVILTVEAEATVNDWGYQIGQQHIRIGEAQNISATSYVASGYIIGVDD
ncbi:MAG: DUF4330 domain-containing protein [Clostridia bacterium]|nr:DUF4330 domain-containing protein [Clostridia bacterium]